ncbi:MAG: nucleotidyltransferase domain-containing protein [Thaumarchaeota archaeon]|nr:MAG: nucleotidyltransferase domain-containing protein [Candidatus Wolframiiraptor sp.]RLG07936.1 MAG: nucleotidyltransferase domain-containing protein [Nitrososphaerota archaeon]HDD40233.1 nucleotidyltransferase domain-containing protein [Nitrososphaeria archaeon]
MIDKELIEYVKRVGKQVKLHAAILFGSRARGDHKPWSDYDILLIGEFKEPYLERLKILFDLTEGIRVPIEPHPYTIDEALMMLERGNPMIVDVIEEGKQILMDEEYEKILRKYREMKKAGKLKRTKTTIIF